MQPEEFESFSNLKLQKILLNDVEQENKIVEYNKKQKKVKRVKQDSEQSNSPVDASSDKPMSDKPDSEKDDEEEVEYRHVYTTDAPEWNYPEMVDELADLLEKQFLKALSASNAEKVTDKTFDSWLDTVCAYRDDDYIEEELRRHIAKHQTPAVIKNESDS